MTRDEWRYIIPRPFLDGLAATSSLGRSTQVFAALLCKMYGVTENSGSETPEATVTLDSLVQMTGRSKREVQKAVEILAQAEVLTVVDAPAGRARVLGLHPGPKWATPEVGHARSGHPGHPSRPESGTPLGPNRAPVGVPDSSTHIEETVEETFLKKPIRGTVEFAELDGAVSSNGDVKHVEKGDDGRRERLRELLVNAVKQHGRRTPAAEQRWLAYVDKLSAELAREDVTERQVKIRAKTWFGVSMWSDLGDSQQAKEMRIRMLYGASPTRAQRDEEATT
jgi:hypothetical protein